MKRNVIDFIRSVFQHHEHIGDVNDTFLCVLPKVAKPKRVMQFRPIGLCNLTYKLITKIIVNRIKHLLPSLVSPNQSSFVP